LSIHRAASVFVCAAIGFGACATSVETGPPIADPASAAAGLLETSGPDAPSFVRFDWTYGDRRGTIEGDGAVRFNPPDSLRLDLFTSGDVAMAVALAGESLTSLGEIEDIEVPPRAFLFAMAGMFRPDSAAPLGFETGGDTVFVYGAEDERLYFFSSAGRLVKVEERRGGRLRRRVELAWGQNPDWPAEAEFRDMDEPSRVRWTIGQTRTRETAYPDDIFTLPHAR
jgi:hypothetical protein